MKLLLILLLFLGFVPPASARKVKQTFKIEKSAGGSRKEGKKLKPQDFEGREISADDSLEWTGKIREISFVGYDKEPNSNKESFLLVNPSDKKVLGYKVKIDYLDLQGRMLHSRIIEETCEVPAGETRRIDIPSWDTQHTYYYYLGNEPKRVATPFKVVFEPLSFRIIE